MLINAYFDESYDGVIGSGPLVVAGYAFSKNGLRHFNNSWAEMLRRYGLPYFRMSACNSNTAPFDRLTERQCDDCARVAISAVRENTLFGHAVIVDQDDYASVLVSNGFEVSAYSFCAWLCLLAVSEAKSKYKNNPKIACYFESGHATESEARRLLDRIINQPDLNSLFKCVGYEFLKKDKSYACQAADMAAWQFRKNVTRPAHGRKKRGDFNALLEGVIHTKNKIDRQHLTRFRDVG